jgi:PAS domain S-box-containing protein
MDRLMKDRAGYLENQLEKLSAERDFYKNMLDELYAVIHVNEVRDKNTMEVKWVNKGVNAVSGYCQEEVINDPDFMKKLLPDDYGVALESVDHIKNVPEGYHSMVCRGQCKDGSKKWFQCYFKVLEKDEGDKSVLSLMLVVDISKKIRNRERLNELLAMQKRELNKLLIDQLTNTEILVAKKIAQGKSLKQIARDLNRSYHTIESHKRNIFKKLGVSKINDIVKLVYDYGLE